MKHFILIFALAIGIVSCSEKNQIFPAKSSNGNPSKNPVSNAKIYYHHIFLCGNDFQDASNDIDRIQNFENYLTGLGITNYENLEITSCPFYFEIAYLDCNRAPSGRLFKFKASASSQSLFAADNLMESCPETGDGDDQLLHYDLLQCQNNPFLVDPSEQVTLTNALIYLQNNGVPAVLSSGISYHTNAIFCAACTCPEGRIVDIKVKPQFVNQLLSLGFYQ